VVRKAAFSQCDCSQSVSGLLSGLGCVQLVQSQLKVQLISFQFLLSSVVLFSQRCNFSQCFTQNLLCFSKNIVSFSQLILSIVSGLNGCVQSVFSILNRQISQSLASSCIFKLVSGVFQTQSCSKVFVISEILCGIGISESGFSGIKFLFSICENIFSIIESLLGKVESFLCHFKITF
jgi:hypothetical protein